MRSSEILTEEANYTYEVEGDWKNHVYITMYSFDPDTAWLLGNDPVEIGAASLDLNPINNTVYIGRIDITRGKGLGNGTRLLSELIRMSKSHGFTSISAYINHSNVESMGLFTKLGFSKYTKSDWYEQYGINVRKEL